MCNAPYLISREKPPFEWLTRVAYRRIEIILSPADMNTQRVAQRFFDAIIHFFMYRFNRNYYDFYSSLEGLQGRVDIPNSPPKLPNIYVKNLIEGLSRLDRLDQLTYDGPDSLQNTHMTEILVRYAFGGDRSKNILIFLDNAIAHLSSDMGLLYRALRRPNHADKVEINPSNIVAGEPRNTPLMLLIKMGGDHSLESVKKILPYYDAEALLDTTYRGNTALHLAIYIGNVEIAMELIAHAQNLGILDEFLNKKNINGKTADDILKAFFSSHDWLDIASNYRARVEEALHTKDLLFARDLFEKEQFHTIWENDLLGGDEFHLTNMEYVWGDDVRQKIRFSLSKFIKNVKPISFLPEQSLRQLYEKIRDSSAV